MRSIRYSKGSLGLEVGFMLHMMAALDTSLCFEKLDKAWNPGNWTQNSDYLWRCIWCLEHTAQGNARDELERSLQWKEGWKAACSSGHSAGWVPASHRLWCHPWASRGCNQSDSAQLGRNQLFLNLQQPYLQGTHQISRPSCAESDWLQARLAQGWHQSLWDAGTQPADWPELQAAFQPSFHCKDLSSSSLAFPCAVCSRHHIRSPAQASFSPSLQRKGPLSCIYIATCPLTESL